MDLEPLDVLARVARSMNLHVVLIGALARQIVFDTRYAGAPYRATRDVDAIVRVSTHHEFDLLASQLVESGEFRRMNAHRFVYRDGSELDLIPFGGIANEDGDLVWPDGRAMSLDGLASADAHAERLVRRGVDVRVVNLPNLLALKLFAYRDRHGQTSKDIDDLIYIFSNSSDALSDRVYNELDGEVIQRLDYEQLGPYLLGRDTALVIASSEQAALTEIIDGRLLTAPDYIALSRMARGMQLERLIAHFEAFRSGLTT